MRLLSFFLTLLVAVSPFALAADPPPLSGAAALLAAGDRVLPEPSPREEVRRFRDRVAAALAQREATSAEPFNVLFYVIDTARADHYGLYGYPRDTSPFLDSLAPEALTWNDFSGASTWTYPGVASMMTSLPVPTHKLDNWTHGLDPGWTTLADILSAEGYYTSLYSSNLALPVWGRMGQFFEHFERTFRPDQNLTDKVLADLEDTNKRPFFIWAQPFGPHTPYTAPPPYDELFVDDDYYGGLGDLPGVSDDCVGGMKAKHVIDGITSMDWYVSQYDGLIAYIDDQLRQVFDALELHGLRESTLVVITADHGENLAGERGYYFCHRDVFEDNVRLPFVIVLPRSLQSRLDLPGGLVFGGRPDQLDILPTVLDILGLEGPTDQMRGTSLVRDLEPHLQAGFNAPNSWLRKGDLKAAHYGVAPVPNEDRTLFDLSVDPLEENDLADDPAWAEIALRMELQIIHSVEAAKALEPDPLFYGVFYASDFEDPADTKGRFNLDTGTALGWEFTTSFEPGNRVLLGRTPPGGLTGGSIGYIGAPTCSYTTEARIKLLAGELFVSFCFHGSQGYLLSLEEDRVTLTRSSGGLTELGSVEYDFGIDRWHTVRVGQDGANLLVRIDGVDVIQAVEEEPAGIYGPVYFTLQGEGASAAIDDLTIERPQPGG